MHPLRRLDCYLDEAATYELLTTGLYGVLATVDTSGQAHATPLNYAHTQENGIHCLYFHVAQKGQKLDNIAHEPRAAFTIVGPTKLLPAKFSIAYQSVMIFGTISEVQETDKKKEILILLTNKYAKMGTKATQACIADNEPKTIILRLAIKHISGKQSKE